MKTLRDNWKLIGLNLYGIQIIPCYYDLLRMGRKIGNRLNKDLPKFNYTPWQRFLDLFDAEKDEPRTGQTKINRIGHAVSQRVASIKVWAS